MSRLLKSFMAASLIASLGLCPAQAAFQEALWGARPAAMAGAYTALADDANAPVYNPAGISMMTQSELTFTYAQLYTGLNLNSADDRSNLGLGYFSYVPSIKDKKYGSYAFTWTNFTASNLYREDSFSLTAADSYQFDSFSAKPVLSYGANIKFLRRSFSTDSRTDADPVFSSGRTSSAMTLDFGMLYHPHFVDLPGLKFGFSAMNVTRPNIGLSSVDRVPAKYSFGVSYQDPEMRLFNPTLDVASRDGRTILSGAVESWVARDTLALRLGGNQDELAGGMGYQFRLFGKSMMRLDYAILWPLYVEGTNGSHRVSISVAF